MIRATRICLVALALVASSWPLRGLAAASASSAPTTTASSQSQLTNLSNKIVEASAEEAALIKKLDAANAKKADTARRIAELDQQMPAVQASLDQATSRLATVDGELAVAEASLAVATVRLHQGKDSLKQRAIDAYMGRPDTTLLGVSVHVVTFREYVALKQYMHAVIAAHVKVVDTYDELHKAAAELQDMVARRRADAQLQRDVVSTQKTALSTAKSTQEKLRADAVTQAAVVANLIKEVRSRRAEFQAKYNQLKAQSDAIARLLKSRQSGQGLTPSGHGVLSSPIPGAPITDGFGPRVHPIFGDVRMHTGVDFAAAEGTPIHAAADGVVVSAGVQGGYGNATIIDHGNSLATLYAHQSRMIVSAGQSVKRGQVIGYVGHTGYATGPHLHFEVRVNGTPVDPMNYL